MTESEWLTSSYLDCLVEHLRTLRWHRTKAGRRKLRLIGCAACRRAWNLLDAQGRAGIEVAEKMAEGQAPALAAIKGGRWSDWMDARSAAANAVRAARSSRILRAADAGSAVCCVAYSVALARGESPVVPRVLERQEQARLLREVTGNPFRPVVITAGCLTPSVVSLAEAAYAERDLPSGHLDAARLAVLSDALEDAGCDNTELLGHLQSPGPHVRGCWALDLVLDKQ
jgi:hypothetical protein